MLQFLAKHLQRQASRHLAKRGCDYLRNQLWNATAVPIDRSWSDGSSPPAGDQIVKSSAQPIEIFIATGPGIFKTAYRSKTRSTPGLCVPVRDSTCALKIERPKFTGVRQNQVRRFAITPNPTGLSYLYEDGSELHPEAK